MAIETCSTATCKCSMGMAPTVFNALPVHRTFTELKPAATIMDNKMGANIITFGMCMSLLNPSVLSATIAAGGVLTPMPCTPIFFAPWIPGSFNVLIGGMPALSNTSMLLCAYMGVINFISPGGFTTIVP